MTGKIHRRHVQKKHQMKEMLQQRKEKRWKAGIEETEESPQHFWKFMKIDGTVHRSEQNRNLYMETNNVQTAAECYDGQFRNQKNSDQRTEEKVEESKATRKKMQL